MRNATMFYIYERKEGSRAEIGIVLRAEDMPAGALDFLASNHWIATQAVQVKRARLAALGFVAIDPESAIPFTQRWERRKDRTMTESENKPRAHSRMNDDQQRQIRHWLTTQPPREIVERNDRNNLDFITWSVKWAMVRYAFPDASIRMGQRWETADGYHLTVVITTAGVEHEGLGFEPRKSEKQVGAYSDSGYKAAYSDAVSRACALVGVGLLLYMDVPISRALIHLLTGEVGTPQPEPQPTPERRPQGNASKTVTPPQDDETHQAEDDETAPLPGDAAPYWITSSEYPGKCADCGNQTQIGDTILYSPKAAKGRRTRCSACGSTHERNRRLAPEERAEMKRNGIPVPGEAATQTPQTPEDVAAWRQKGDASKLSQDLVAAIKMKEEYLGANAIAGYRDQTVLRDTRAHFLDGTAALNNKPAFALAGYLAWLNHKAEANTPAQHP